MSATSLPAVPAGHGHSAAGPDLCTGAQPDLQSPPAFLERDLPNNRGLKPANTTLNGEQPDLGSSDQRYAL